MKKIFSTLILVLGVLTIGSAQPMDTVKTWPSTFSLGAFITPSFSYRNLIAIDRDQGVANSISASNRDDVPALLFEGGVRANMMIGNRLRFTAAGVYAKRGYQSNREFPDHEDQVYRAYTTYDYIEVPLMLSFAIAKDSNRAFYLIGGISNGFLQKRMFNSPVFDSVSRTITFVDDDVDAEGLETRGYNMYQAAALFGIEANFRIAESVSLFAQPMLKYNLTPLRSKEQGIGRVIDERLFSIGIAFGVDFHF